MSPLLTAAEGLQELLRLASGDAPNCVNDTTIKDVIARVQHGLPLDAVAQQLGLELFNYQPYQIIGLIAALQEVYVKATALTENA